MRIVVLTHFASPYQIELFDAVEKLWPDCLRVYYLHKTHQTRNWTGGELSHHAVFLSEKSNVLSVTEADFKRAELAIFNFYSEWPSRSLMHLRSELKLPWVFWGERPGFKHPFLGRLARLWFLKDLHRSNAPIWGIGEFAIQGYQAEFGLNRQYVNLPYFSDLNRFSKIRQGGRQAGEKVILFSGAMIRRKGVDLLAEAFVRVARQNPHLRLHLLGAGELEKDLRKTLAPVEGQVNFLGFKDWHELPAVYAGADVLAVPSRYDGWGLVVPEGLAAGLPVIATNRMGAALDLLQDGVNGWMINPDDLPGLEAALQKVAALGKDDMTRMSSAARHSVEEHDLAHGARRFVLACRSAIEAWRS